MIDDLPQLDIAIGIASDEPASSGGKLYRGDPARGDGFEARLVIRSGIDA